MNSSGALPKESPVSLAGELFLSSVESFESSLSSVERGGVLITFGTFDVFHEMHKRLLDRARQLGAKLIIYVSQGETKRGGKSLYDHDFKRRENVRNHLIETGSLLYGDVEIRIKTKKHLLHISELIQEFSDEKSLTFFGGEDQFSDYPELINLCKTHGVNMVSTDRGEGLCSTEIRAKIDRVKRLSGYGLDFSSATISPGFFKAKGFEDEKALLKQKANELTR